MTNGLSELELDRIFALGLRDRADFRSWFLAAVGLSDDYELIWDDRWHQRWYRCPETKRDSETDIFVRFRRKFAGNVIGIHIENKPPWGQFRGTQVEDYSRRAAAMAKRWDYSDWLTVIIAPSAFLEGNAERASAFGSQISYEMLATQLPEFAIIS